MHRHTQRHTHRRIDMHRHTDADRQTDNTLTTDLTAASFPFVCFLLLSLHSLYSVEKKTISLPQFLAQERRITGLASCQTLPRKQGEVIWLEINPFLVNTPKLRGIITRQLGLGTFQAGDLGDSSSSQRWTMGHRLSGGWG